MLRAYTCLAGLGGPGRSPTEQGTTLSISSPINFFLPLHLLPSLQNIPVFEMIIKISGKLLQLSCDTVSPCTGTDLQSS